MTNIAVFASGTGSNAVNLVKAFNAGNRIHVALCLTDRENAPVTEKMKELGVETIYFPRRVWKEDPQPILEALRRHDIKVIALAGFLCFVSDEIVDAYEGRILNIHPSLLPAYGGKGMHGANVHKAVIEAGETKSGATVHVVTKEIDAGPVVVQREVAVLPDDTPESLEAKVHEVEYLIFPEAVMKTVAALRTDGSVKDSGASAPAAGPTPPP
ncbi:MAG: phosphoribosylglycinamide formyltransferase, partial [Muribaculaceae bacterium]|nr:phosphoribosylglycinamide formyltransferase [Muribaculaceae bacterium]